MKPQRESLQTDIAMMIGGPLVIAIGLLIRGNNIPYAPSDPRSQPFYGETVVLVAFVLGVVLFGTGLVRLILGLRHRDESR